MLSLQYLVPVMARHTVRFGALVTHLSSQTLTSSFPRGKAVISSKPGEESARFLTLDLCMVHDFCDPEIWHSCLV